MDEAAGNKPLLGGRGLMLIDEFLRATGLDRTTADALVRDRKVEGLYHPDGQVVGVFDDVLPTKETLHSWGLGVRDDYNPERHRSYVGADDDADAFGVAEVASGSSATWTMSWGDDES